VTTRKEVEQKKRITPRLFSGYCQDGFLLDDHARAQISIELDYELPYLIHKGACEEEKRHFSPNPTGNFSISPDGGLRKVAVPGQLAREFQG